MPTGRWPCSGDEGQGNQQGGTRLEQLQREIDAGLDRYLSAQGPERQALTLRLLRLRWEREELEAAAITTATSSGLG